MALHGKKKILTLSYDDGVEQDIKLIEILNKYGIKATFNLNSGIQSRSSQFTKNDVQIRRMNVDKLPELYKGHEIAVHSLTHPRLNELDEETIINELVQDKINLERIFGEKMRGMAYPFGTFNETVVNLVRKSGLLYARGVKSTQNYDIPKDLLTYQPTVHHKDPGLIEHAENFIKLMPNHVQVFYVWGHSYEFDVDNNWHVIEEFCKIISGRDDICYATNAEALLGTI